MTRRILVVLGANLELVGRREPEVYGRVTMDEIRAALEARARARGLELVWASSNHEGDLVDAVGAALGGVAGVLVNPGAYTHTSIALRDALAALAVPAIEVHLSNIYAREEFRRRSVISDVVTGVVSGLGAAGFLHALDALADLLDGAPFPARVEAKP